MISLLKYIYILGHFFTSTKYITKFPFAVCLYISIMDARMYA